MSEVPLRALQQWIQSAITHPGGVIAGAEEGVERIGIETVIGRSHSLSAVDRLEIYNRSYFARLLECMRVEYSVLATALGEELFDSFALGYLQQYPSRSYTLGELGERFPEYLAATRPRGGTTGEGTIERESNQAIRSGDFSDRMGIGPTEGEREDEYDWPEFMIDLARLERTINVVFDGLGTERRNLLDQTRLAAISAERWAETRLECVPCLKLLALSYPVNDYFTAVRRGEMPEMPDRAASFLAITRREYRVYRVPQTAVQFELLQLLNAGEQVGTAIQRAISSSNATDEQLASDIRHWFREWTASGFFLDAR